MKAAVHSDHPLVDAIGSFFHGIHANGFPDLIFWQELLLGIFEVALDAALGVALLWLCLNVSFLLAFGSWPGWPFYKDE